MRPQDIVILLKVITIPRKDWQYRDLASSLIMSTSEVSESLIRSHMAGLIDESRRKVHRRSLLEFLEHGLHYVFPQAPGTMVTGTATAHSHPYFAKFFNSELNYVWPFENGHMRGLSITPLHKSVPEAVKNDERLHLLLSALDIIRVGRVREMEKAINVLHKEINHESSTEHYTN